MKLWGDMTPAEKSAAAVRLVRGQGLTFRDAAIALGTTKGAVCGAVWRPERYVSRRTVRPPLPQLADDVARQRLFDAVVREFGQPAEAVATIGDRRYAAVLARHVWWYLLNQLPVPPYLSGKNGSWRRTREVDGNANAIARLCGTDARNVLKALRKIEDMRDDPKFDARIEKLERILAA